MIRGLLFPLAVALTLMAGNYESEIRAWREARERALQADGGWLTVAGLYWLKDEANSFGSGAANDIVLPDGPARAGVFSLQGEKVTVTMDGAAPRALRPDDEGDSVKIRDLTMFAIKRGERYGIRMKDKNSQMRREFTGLHWYPVKEAARVTARFVAQPGKITIPNILGQKEDQASPGYAVFNWEGQEVRLYPVTEGDSLFFIFRDRTSGKETYGAGRFLNTGLPQDGKLVIDFNKAYNPPCAFTPYATCPLPPRQNQLAVRVEAGEMKYGSH